MEVAPDAVAGAVALVLPPIATAFVPAVAPVPMPEPIATPPAAACASSPRAVEFTPVADAVPETGAAPSSVVATDCAKTLLPITPMTIAPTQGAMLATVPLYLTSRPPRRINGARSAQPLRLMTISILFFNDVMLVILTRYRIQKQSLPNTKTVKAPKLRTGDVDAVISPR